MSGVVHLTRVLEKKEDEEEEGRQREQITVCDKEKADSVNIGRSNI